MQFTYISQRRDVQATEEALKRKHPALQNMKFLNVFLFFVSHFSLLDPDSGSGSTDLIEYGSNTEVRYGTVQYSGIFIMQ
jgi:hypothetical protein